MRKFLQTVCFILLSYSCHSQERKIDSFNRLISGATSDTQRINYLIAKARFYGEVNLDSAITLFRSVIDKAGSIGYSKGEGEGCYRLASCYCYKGMFSEALEYLNTSQKIFTKLNDTAGLVSCYIAYGSYDNMRGIYDSGIAYYHKAISIAERHKLNEHLKTCYNNIGIAYQMQSNYSSALIYFQKGLRIAEEDKDLNTQAYLLLNLGLTLRALNDYAAAEKSFLKTIELAKQDGATIVELYAYSNIASVYSSMSKPELAYSSAVTATTLAKKIGDDGMVVSNMSRAARELAAMGKFKEAEEMGKKALYLSAKVPEYNASQANIDMGYIKTMQNKYLEAIPLFEKAFAMMKNNSLYDLATAEAYNEFALSYEKTGNYKRSLETYKKAAAISDSVESRENIRKATELRMNYDFETKQRIAKAEQDKKESDTKRTRNLQYFAIGAILLLAVFLFIYSYQKSKAKAKIEKAYSKLQSTQAQLIQSEKMASLGELTAGIAHEIQNPLNFVNNFSELNRELMEDLYEEQNKEARNLQIENEILGNINRNLEKVIHHGKRADAIVKGMLQHTGTTKGQKEPTDINALAGEYLRLSYHGLRAKDKTFKATLQTNFDAGLSTGQAGIGKINIVPQDVGRVLLNLYNNAFYAIAEKSALIYRQVQSELSPGSTNSTEDPYEPTVSVSTKMIKLTSRGPGVLITVKDNGNGIPQKVLDKIFQPFFTTKPTGLGTGLGLSISYDIIKAHGGDIRVETKEGEGTTFIVQL